MFKKITLALLLTFPFVSPVSGMNNDFRVDRNGSIEIQGQKFSSFDSYLRSDFFRERGMRCGTRLPAPGKDNTATAKSVSHCTSTLTNLQNEYWPSSLTYIMPVWFHVIYKNDGTGYVSDARIKSQIKVLNEDYGALAGTLGKQGYNTRIQFTLAGITRTKNNKWFTDDEEKAYKPALKKDTSKYINIYTTMASGYLGYAYFPQDSAGSELDGIVLLHESVGGRNNGFSIYDQGRTLVHEMGHYLGLYHTFQGGSECLNSYTKGDLIVDTPAESEPDYTCDETSSCGTPDPIHNYMDYGDDLCINQFSREQANRAVCSLVNYRPATYRIIKENSVVIPPLIKQLIMK